MEQLKLIALDTDDLAVVSAHLQDSDVKVGEILWRPKENRLVMALDRFDWVTNGKDAGCWRRKAALRFERVMACQCKNVLSAQKDKVLNLLAIDFAESDAPAGTVTLMFEDGAMLRLEVECLEVELADLGPVWAVDCCPGHSEIEGEGKKELA